MNKIIFKDDNGEPDSATYNNARQYIHIADSIFAADSSIALDPA